MANAADLVVELRATLNKFEGDMKKAGDVGEREAKRIEERFDGMTRSITVGSALGNLIGSGIRTAFSEAQKWIDDTARRLKEFQTVAELTGMSLSKIWTLQSAGVAGGAVAGGLRSLGSQLNEAARGEDNGLTRMFEANSKSIKDANGEVISMQRALEIVADLVRNAGTEFDKIDILRMVGLTEEWKKALEGGSGALRDGQSHGEEMGKKLEEIARLAKDFDDYWKGSIDSVKAYFMSNFGEVQKFIENFVGGTGKALQNNPLGIDWITKAGNQMKEAADKVGGGEDGLTGGPLVMDLNKRRKAIDPAGTRTIIPSKKSGGGGEDGITAFEREERRAQETVGRLEAERNAIGLNVGARERMIETVRLEQMLTRDGVTITDEYRQRIEKLASSLGNARQAFADAAAQQQRFRDFQQMIGQEMVGFFSDVLSGSASVEESLRRMTARIGEMALQALILGQGPLAMLMGGNAAQGGNAGGLIGALFGPPGRAAGGSVDAGKTYVVGERGPEIFTPSTNGAIGARGQGGGVAVNVINNAGARVEAQSSQGPRGTELTIMVEQAVARSIAGGGLVDKTLRGRYGVNPAAGGR